MAVRGSGSVQPRHEDLVGWGGVILEGKTSQKYFFFFNGKLIWEKDLITS